MTLVDELLKADAKKADELKTGTYLSERLAHVLGKDEPVEISIKEIASRRLNDILAYQIDAKGNVDFSKSFYARLMVCIEGITNPDLKIKELQAHFGVGTAKELAEKLFGSEVTEISDAISKLSGIVAEDNEEEIKN